jgi:hypothetical protein
MITLDEKDFSLILKALSEYQTHIYDVMFGQNQAMQEGYKEILREVNKLQNKIQGT